MSSGLLALIAGGLGGYMQGTKDKAEQDRLNEDRAYQNDLRARQKKQFAEEDVRNEALKKAGSNAQVVEDSVDPIVASATNPGIPSPQNSASNSTPKITNPYDVMRAKGIDVPTQTVPMITNPNDVRREKVASVDADAASPLTNAMNNALPPITKRYKVGDQVFEGDDGKIKAEQYAKKMNNPISKASRIADVYDSAGKFDEAQRYRDWIDHAGKSGLMDSIEMINGGDIAGAIRHYNSTRPDLGQVDESSVKAEPVEWTGPGGVKLKGYRVTGTMADGTPFPTIENTAEFLFRHQGFDKQYGQQLQGAQVDIARDNANKPILHDFGDRVGSIDPRTGKVTYVGEIGLSPNTQAQLRAAEIKAMSEGKPKLPPGYRMSADGQGMEPIPGGPADNKMKGKFDADSAALSGINSSFDRLSTAANEVLSHPGMDGIFGMKGMLPNIPGGEAANAAALLNTLKSQIGFSVLQDMRNNSKTGGALGAVSDKENQMLQSNLAALDKAQSADQARESLKKIIDYAESAKERMRGAFNSRYPNGEYQGTANQGAQKTIVRTGTLNGKKVVQYSDGSTAYQP